MDARKRETLILIEELAGLGNRDDRGYQLVMVAHDYLEDDDLPRARDVLSRVEPAYFTEGIWIRCAESDSFAKTVADLLDAFGLDLTLARSRGFDA